jgi:hypothetical protein
MVTVRFSGLPLAVVVLIFLDDEKHSCLSNAPLIALTSGIRVSEVNFILPPRPLFFSFLLAKTCVY